MSRHARPADRRTRTTRISTVTVVWLAGLAAGFFGLLSAAARYGCAGSDHGFGCEESGSVVGILIVIAVVAVVTAVTVLSHDRSPRSMLILGTLGVAALAVCFVFARVLLDTV